MKFCIRMICPMVLGAAMVLALGCGDGNRRGDSDRLSRQEGGPLPARPMPESDPQLLIAAREGDVETVRRLVKERSAVDTRGVGQMTPLMAAAKNGHGEVVKVLLENGADANLRDWKGKTARAHARDAGHEAVLKVLDEAYVEAPRGPAKPIPAPPARPAPKQ